MLRWRLKEVMAEKGLDMAEVVRRSGVSRRTLATLYSNPLHVGKLSTLDKLASGLGVSPCELIEAKRGEALAVSRR